jgi:hypothetical protein
MKKGLSEQQILERLGVLPLEIKPERDVWPAIEQKIRREDRAYSQKPASRWWMHAVAASVTVIFVTGVLIGKQWSTTPMMTQPGVGHENQVQSVWLSDMAGALTASEFEYQAAFREFISVGDFRENLPPRTVENLTAGWTDLSKAEAALTHALQDNPSNSFLNTKLLELRSRQLDFLKQIASFDQNSRRTTI